jgi:pimeloyl-ACP methyl ester carboxylesterase
MFLILTVAVTMAMAQMQAPSARRVHVNGIDLAYVEQGGGVPVVFAHGAVGDHRFWEPQREAFAKEHRFVAITHRYHGTGAWPDEGQSYSPKTHAADLAAFITALKAGPVHLVGLSYGGALAAMVASTEPHLVRTLTLAEPALFSLLADTEDGKPVLEEWTRDAAAIGAALKEGDAVRATKQLVEVVTGHPAERFDELPAPLRHIVLDNARTLPPLFAAAPETLPCAALSGIKAPTLVIRGERTPRLFVKTNERVVRCIPGSRAVVVPDASHGMSFDNPSGFNQAVLAFINGK